MNEKILFLFLNEFFFKFPILISRKYVIYTRSDMYLYGRDSNYYHIDKFKLDIDFNAVAYISCYVKNK